ncbi:DUF3822 family protein [bacterium]|nr:DUF3822 family protein [bacterium]
MSIITETGVKIYNSRMSAYVNAVSDKLYLISYPNKVSCCIAGKEGRLKWYGNFNDIRDSLSDALFTEYIQVYSDSKFVLCPSGLSKQEQQLHFNLSEQSALELKSVQLSDQIEIVFTAEDRTQGFGLKVKPTKLPLVYVLDRYKSGLSRSNAIYITCFQGKVLIRAYSASHLILANIYDAPTDDDVFYFVMFAMEQLKFDLSSIHFEYMGIKEDFERYQALFKNYMPALHYNSFSPVDTSGLEHEEALSFEQDWLTKIAVQCV